MKLRALILASVVLVFLIGLQWLTRPTSVIQNAPLVTPANPTAVVIQTATSSPTLTYKVPGSGKYQGLSDPRWEWWNAMDRQDPSFQWKMPINFYGKVLDSNGVPIQGAKIRFQWTDMSAKGTSEKITESASDGTFSLIGESGKRLGVNVTKSGFHAGSKSFGSYEYAAFFEWNFHESDETNPIIFQLVKTINAEPLLVREVFNSLTYEQGTYYYDFNQGKLSRQSTGGDALKISITRSQAAQGLPFDWTWTVDGFKATVQPTSDEFPQIAPADAYLPSWKTEGKANAENFKRQGKVRLYVRTSDDRFAVVDLALSHPNAREVGPTLSVKSFLNTTPGSLNLEFDPAKVVRSP